MGVQTSKILSAVSPQIPQFIRAAENIIPERSCLNVQPLLERIKVNAHNLNFGVRIFRHDLSISPEFGLQFSGLCTDLPAIKCYLYAHVFQPNGRIELTHERVMGFRQDCVRKLLHETIHAVQFGENKQTGVEDTRVFGTARERQKYSRQFPQPSVIEKDLRYLADSAEIESYASCIAMEWTCTALRTKTWLQFLKHWRTHHRGLDVIRYKAMDFYADYWREGWSTHSVMRRLRKKVHEFADAYRALPVLEALYT